MSSFVYAVLVNGRPRWVAKTPRRRFRVAARWLVDRERIDVEVRFARLVGPALGAGAVPRIRHYDPESRVAVFDHAPARYSSWKARLLGGRLEPAVAQHAGRLLAGLHGLGLRHPEWRRRFQQPRLLRQQRTNPFFRTAAQRHPDHAGPLRDIARRLEASSTTLVHGDFSPKNLLTDGRRVRLVDHEVAHWGDPRFDVAFLLAHLRLKALARPRRAAPLSTLARSFLDAYRSGPRPDSRSTDPEFEARLVAALVLARVDGKSPVEYLDPSARRRARALARDWLQHPPKGFEDLVDRGFRTHAT